MYAFNIHYFTFDLEHTKGLHIVLCNRSEQSLMPSFPSLNLWENRIQNVYKNQVKCCQEIIG